MRLIVSDDMSNSYPAYMAIRVLSTNMPPEISGFGNHPGENNHGIPHELFFVVVDGGSDPDGKIVAYEFDFGDGKTTHVTADEINPETLDIHPQISHFYESAGNYTATVTAIDDRGARTTKSVDLTISNNKLPIPRFSVNVVANTLDPTSYDIQLDGRTASDPDGTIICGINLKLDAAIKL